MAQGERLSTIMPTAQSKCADSRPFGSLLCSLGLSRNLPLPRTSAGEHVEIAAKPIGTRLLFNRKPFISCDRTTPKRVNHFPRVSYYLWKTNLASRMKETPKKIVGNNFYLCSLPLIPEARNKSVWQGLVKTNLQSLQCKMGLTSLHDFYAS